MYVCWFQECSKRANNGKFTLRDLLVVPMQRVLKYHLLLQVRATGTGLCLRGNAAGAGDELVLTALIISLISSLCAFHLVLIMEIIC